MFDKPASAEWLILNPRLLRDSNADQLEQKARAVLDANSPLSPSECEFALGILLLARDRRARIAQANEPMTGSVPAFFEDLEHLTVQEAGIYAILLSCTWRMGPLPLEPLLMQERTGFSDAQLALAQTPLRAFFARTPMGWIHKRIESERQAWTAPRAIDMRQPQDDPRDKARQSFRRHSTEEGGI
jgi:uncharacterized protein YdaU (DUF1376 family)